MIYLGHKIFKKKDQIFFSKISDDYNDIHLNNFAAKKLIYGQQIVHGVNILLTALNFFFKYYKFFLLKRLDCNFLKPVFLNEKIFFYLKRKFNKFYLSVETQNTLCCVILINNSNTIDYSKDFFFNKKFFFKKKKLSLNKYYLYLKKKINSNILKEILSISYLVGMLYPGKYSLLSSISIDNLHNNFKKKYYSYLIKKNKKIGKYEILLNGNTKSHITAFSYIIHHQLNISNLKKIVKKKFLNNKRTLIIGASSGLGETTAKLMALVGSDLFLTYNNEIKNIYKIKKDINRSTSVNCKIFKANILKKNFLNKIKNINDLDYIFYFATPKILQTSYNKFNYDLYRVYKSYYVDQFYKFCFLISKITKKKVKVFYPSTIFLNYKNRLYNEYILAKKQAEKKYPLFKKKIKNIKIFFCKLPEMTTNQNIRVLQNKKINRNANIIFPLIKKFIHND